MHDPDLHLFAHERHVSLRQNLYRMVHPMRRESIDPVLPADGGAEGTAIGYATAVREAESGQFRLWYMTHADHTVRLAISSDGMEWERRGPAVDEGERFSIDNLALMPVGPDADPWCTDAQLAGYAYCNGPPDTPRGVHCLRSMDGERLQVREPGILPGVGDRSSLYLDEITGEYSLISRPSGRTPGFRSGELVRGRSANLWKGRDLITWENQGIALKYDDADRSDVEIYGMQPFRYGQGFLALVEVYYRGVERLQTQLAHSADGVHWERVEPRDPVLAMGGQGAWDSHWVVSTNNPPFLQGDRLLVLYSGASTKHGSKNRHRRSIGLASLRRDGWVSLEAGRTEGVVVTVPLPLERPMQLELNVDCRTGYISTEVLSAEDGKESTALSLYEAESSKVEAIDSVRHPVRWGERAVVDPVQGGRCHLRFAMMQGSFYAFRWTPAKEEK